MDTTETRLAALETSARRWRALAVGLLLAGGAAVAVPAWQSPAQAQAPAAKPEPSEIVRTRRLEVVNADGRTVALIASTKGDAVALFKAGDGTDAVEIIANPVEGSQVNVNHANGKPGVTLSVFRDGSAGVDTRSPTGQPIGALRR